MRYGGPGFAENWLLSARRLCPDQRRPAILKQPNGMPGKKPPAPSIKLGWAGLLWSKDQAASRLRHQRGADRLSARGPIRLKWSGSQTGSDTAWQVVESFLVRGGMPCDLQR